MQRVVLAMLFVSLAAAEAKADAFGRLQGLVGMWEARSGGKELRVEFKLISGGSTLVETYGVGGRETITVFHMDGARLLATHYCAQGNQPRLAMTKEADKAWVFDFVDATNLKTAASAHLHHLEIAMSDGDHFSMVESYREAGKDQAETHRFTRVK